VHVNASFRSEPFCTVFRNGTSDPVVWLLSADDTVTTSGYGARKMLALAGKRNEMHPEDLMKPDLLSEIVLMGSVGVLFASLLLIVVVALTRV
jgi:hypothetical protein